MAQAAMPMSSLFVFEIICLATPRLERQALKLVRLIYKLATIYE
jgi:hypothetical protein